MKTALAASLLIHAAALGALVYFQGLRSSATSNVVVPQPVLVVVAALDEESATETASITTSPKASTAATPQAAEVTPPPEPEHDAESPQPVPTELAVLPEPLAQLVPEVPPRLPSNFTQPTASGPFVPTPAMEKTSDEVALSAGGGESVFTGGQPNYRPNPRYPLEAQRRGEEGLVIVTVVINARGIPESVKVTQSSGHQLLDDAVIRAVKAWEFEPTRLNGKGIPATKEVPVNFKLSK